MNFKAQLKQDIKNVFHNTHEFADVQKIFYNGRQYNIPIILDYEGTKDRKKPSSDNVDGIFLVDVTMYVAFSDLKVIPRQGHKIEIDDDIFKIVKVGNEAGELILDLERLDE